MSIKVSGHHQSCCNFRYWSSLSQWFPIWRWSPLKAAPYTAEGLFRWFLCIAVRCDSSHLANDLILIYCINDHVPCLLCSHLSSTLSICSGAVQTWVTCRKQCLKKYNVFLWMWRWKMSLFSDTLWVMPTLNTEQHEILRKEIYTVPGNTCPVWLLLAAVNTAPQCRSINFTNELQLCSKHSLYVQMIQAETWAEAFLTPW